MTQFDAIVRDIESHTQHSLTPYQLSPIDGGSINEAYHLQSGEHAYFIKVNQVHLSTMFEAESLGMSALRSLNCIRIPEVICYGQTEDHSYLALEYIELSPLRGRASKTLGTQLAQLHHVSHSFFGWHCDNTIGSTPQYNNREHNWCTFWQQHRLQAQLTIAAKQGYMGALQTQGQRLIEKLPAFFDSYSPKASLLHGDLWSGNAAADPHGNPVIFDPACYYGDSETDIAMTELFGGFDRDFYTAYQAEHPLDKGYKTRKTLYNLYHIINHLNLFGPSYLSQAETMIKQLLTEV